MVRPGRNVEIARRADKTFIAETSHVAAGFTLVEMMIVLAVLAMVAAFGLPAVNRMSSRGQLADAAGQIRAELGRARLDAIRSGVPRQFRFQLGGRRFEISSRAASVGGDVDLFGDFGAAEDTDQSPEPVTEQEGDDAVEHELDDGVCFAQDLAQLPPSGVDPLGDESATTTDADQNWSLPIVFYPDGRTLNAHFLLADDHDYYVEITLRGLTGAASVGAVTARPKQDDAYLGSFDAGVP